MSKVTKEYLYTITLGDFYQWKVYKITDAACHVHYVGERTNHGATVLADKEVDIRPQLEWQVPLINEFWAKVK